MQKQILNTSKKKREISWCKWFFSNTSINMHIKNYVLEYLLNQANDRPKTDFMNSCRTFSVYEL